MGDTCWTIARADRAAVLVDGAAYFGRLRQSLLAAKRSILILGWDFDASISLDPRDPEVPPLGSFLRSLVEEAPDLEVRILVWSVAVIHAPGAPLPLLLGEDWEEHPRITVRLDREHPFYASHHQKLVCIDGNVAFVGGMDLTVRRWDTQAHEPADPCRLGPDGSICESIHDVQMVVEGPVAEALAGIAAQRWRCATGETLAPAAPEPGAWPAGLAPDFTSTDVAVSRTMPRWRSELAVREVERLTETALLSARRSIYIETQYFTSRLLRRLLAKILNRPDGPEIVVLVTMESRGLVERLFMGANRDRLVRSLTRTPGARRLRVYTLAVHSSGTDYPIKIHSKVLIVDDAFLRIGSSNLNNRSMGLDTECDISIEAGSASEARAIAGIRERLLAEHLGTSPDSVAEVHAATDSLIRTIDSHEWPESRMRPFAVPSAGPSRPMPGTALVDPAGPLHPLRLLGL